MLESIVVLCHKAALLTELPCCRSSKGDSAALHYAVCFAQDPDSAPVLAMFIVL